MERIPLALRLAVCVLPHPLFVFGMVFWAVCEVMLREEEVTA